jgi:hypothetical protein
VVAVSFDLSGSECRGLHLFFDHKQRSHLVVTYWNWPGTQWMRRYSIVWPHAVLGHKVEFAFTFGFFGPFKEFCRVAHLFERVVASLEWS